jgi:hypothetical protein
MAQIEKEPILDNLTAVVKSRREDMINGLFSRRVNYLTSA